MKIRVLLGDERNDAVYHWRVKKPFEHLRRYGIDADVVEIGREIPSDTDIVVLPKMYVEEADRPEAEKLFRELRENGALIVYDADDDMWSEYFTSYMSQLTYGSQAVYKKQRLLVELINEYESIRIDNLWTVHQCDAITVSNRELADYVGELTKKPTYFIENAIDVKDFERSLKPKQSTEFVTVGWAGGSRPQSDLHNMLAAWNVIAATNDNVKFVIGGWLPNLEPYENLTVHNLILIPWTSVEDYASSMQVDIGCVCVDDSVFSRRKTPIKAWEFALCDAMVVGSKTLYGDQPIVTCESVQDWINTLQFYVTNPELRAEMSKMYTKHVKAQHDLASNWVYWADAYQKILNTVKTDEREPIQMS